MEYHVSSGQVSSGIVLNYDSMFVYDGGTADSTTVDYASFLNVCSGGIVNSTTVNSGGHVHVSDGGTANSTTINSGGYVYVYDGGTVNSTTINSGGNVYVYDGGTANSATINSGGYVYVYDGGTVNSTTINSGGLYVSSGGMMNGTIINSGGYVHVSNGVTAEYTTVNSGASLYVWEGGTALNVIENGGYVSCAEGVNISFAPNVFSGLVVDNWTDATVHSGTTANGTILNLGFLDVYSGGTADSTTINSGGYVYVYDGGTANSTTINSGGWLSVSSGGMMNGTIINSGGGLNVSNGVTAEYTTVNSGASLYVREGGTALNVIENGGYVSCAEGVNISFAPNVFSGLVLDNRTSATVHSGTTANGTILNLGFLDVYSGGTVNGTIINSGSLNVLNGGTANSTTINSGGNVYVEDGGTANRTTVNSQGQLYVSSGGMADITVINGGCVTVGSAGTVNSTAVNSGGSLNIGRWGTAADTVINDGCVGVSSGGSAIRATLNSCGDLIVSRGGSASGISVNSGGWLEVQRRGTAFSTTVNPGGWLTVCGGGKIAGLRIASGGNVAVDFGGIVDFDVSGLTPENEEGLVNDLSLIMGNPVYVITVSAVQTEGSYLLAGGASGFSGTLSIGTAGTTYGTVTVNGPAASYYGYTFGLSTAGDDLVLTVSGSGPGDLTLSMVGEFSSRLTGDRLAVYSDGTFVLTGLAVRTDKILGTLNPDKWEVLGAFDFDADGLLELAVEDKTTGNVFLADDLNGGISESKLTGGLCLGALGEGYSFFGAGHIDGKAGDNDILLLGTLSGDPSGPKSYGLPVWVHDQGVKQYNGWLGTLVNTWQEGDPLQGDTSDPADVNAKNYRYDVMGIGDFNGDGRDDLILQNSMPDQVSGTPVTGAGDVFTFLTGDETAVETGTGPTVCYAGKVDAINLNGWSIAGTGDFNNDGVDDVLLQEKTTGGVACWIMNNGQMQNSEWIGTMASGEQIAGIWDVNGDGTDDVVLSTDTGYEAWTLKDGTYSGTQILA